MANAQRSTVRCYEAMDKLAKVHISLYELVESRMPPWNDGERWTQEFKRLTVVARPIFAAECLKWCSAKRESSPCDVRCMTALAYQSNGNSIWPMIYSLTLYPTIHCNIARADELVIVLWALCARNALVAVIFKCDSRNRLPKIYEIRAQTQMQQMEDVRARFLGLNEVAIW